MWSELSYRLAGLEQISRKRWCQLEKSVSIRPFIFISLFHEPADPIFWKTGKEIKIHFKTFFICADPKFRDFRIFGLRAIAIYRSPLMSKERNIKKLPAMTVAYFHSLFLSPSIFHVFPLVIDIISCIWQVFILAVSVYSATHARFR